METDISKKKICQVTAAILAAVVLAAALCIQPSAKAKAPAFDFKAKKVRLNSGYEMPIIGLGTWTLEGKTCEDAVYAAIKSGARLIDTADYYGNQKEVGAAVRKAISDGLTKRKDIFITSKLVPYGNSEDYDREIRECNEELGLDYIDLMLIHQRGSGEKKLYQAMERAVKNRTVKSIGISNYYTKEAVDEIAEDAEIMPAVIQNENHIFYQNRTLQKYVKKYGTVIEAWYPFGGRGNTSESLDNKVIKKLAKKYKKTSAQVILRWQLQAGFIAIPGSSNPEHIAENLEIFDFKISKKDMKKIYQLHTGVRYENW